MNWRLRLEDWKHDPAYEWDRLESKVCMWIAHWLPRKLVYWCAIRVFTHATVGKWSDQIVPDLTAIDALKRWYPEQANG